MAKKAKKAYAGDPGDEHVEKVVTPVVETPKPKTKVEPKKPTWEIKDRTYFLKGGKKPLSYTVKSANVHWFDEEKGYERELKYCSNQRTPFVDEMIGDQRLEHIVFRSGVLLVPREKTVLQKLLSLYHPHKNKLYKEFKPEIQAENEIDWLEMEIQALNEAMNLDVDMAEAVMRVEIGSRVSEMSSKELKEIYCYMPKEILVCS